MNREQVQQLFATGMGPYDRKVNRRWLDDLVNRFLSRPDKLPDSSEEIEEEPLQQLFTFLKGRVEEDVTYLLDIRRRYAEYAKRYSRAATAEDRERHVLNFARDLGRSRKELRGDRQSLARWFGHDAMTERYQRRHCTVERGLSFMLERLGVLAETILSTPTHPIEIAFEWRRLQLEGSLKLFFAYEGDSRVTVAAFRSLARALRAVPSDMRERSVDENTLQFIYRAAMHPRLDVWLQCEALNLLEYLSADSFEKVLVQRLTRPAEGDDMFVRKRAVKLLGANLENLPSLAELLPVAAADPSAFVRQGLAQTLHQLPDEPARQWFRHLVRQDEASEVRATALLESVALLERPTLQEDVLAVIQEVCAEEEATFVLRVATHVAVEATRQLVESADAFAESWATTLTLCLETLHVEADDLALRRWAALAREQIWGDVDPEARQLKRFFTEQLADLEPSKRMSFPRSTPEFREDDAAGRVLSVLSQNDFGYELTHRRPRLVITRGHVFGFRLWRFLHEIRFPATDKRQAFRHTVGRLFDGDLRAPSSILCELAQTRVPGEPLFQGEESGWRPYLPLVDELVSCVGQRPPWRPVKIYTPEGVTEVLPPRGPAQRLKAYRKLTTRFGHYSDLRNWRSQLQESPASYIQELNELGFVVSIRPHGDGSERATSMDPAVTRFFPQSLAAPALLPESLDDIWRRMNDYFVAAYDNSLFELAVFTAAASSLFIGRHVYANAAVRRSRDRVPLVVGGWGTRGKSGTERLKAALFNALGYGIVSKTTGCEAMFLYAYPYGETREMFLFRSYDKATIWEQQQVLQLADELNAEVFLWECMALTPGYVHVLQRHWVRDDVSTITNTYPDHEDLQGPAGINIPEVMSLFIPRKAKLITTEDQMTPILAEGAKKVDTPMRHVTWLEFGLLTRDVLERFPYDEHPNNIALVLELAEELGIDRDFAVKEMADRVVPDLGVLKTTPTAVVRRRRLQFTNGCSANERHGALGNWTRLGFDQQDRVAEPDVWVTTVVNNRADRVPRSKVFARLLVEDFSADRHFLIGGNLKGFVGFVREAWDSYASNLTLWPQDSEQDAVEVLRETFQSFRAPIDESQARARFQASLQAMDLPPAVIGDADSLYDNDEALEDALSKVDGLTDEAEAISKENHRNRSILRKIQEFETTVAKASASEHERVDGEFRELLWQWFEGKLVAVNDYHVSGDQLVNIICHETPPGYLNRIIGLQNIKGTGLDFVYRWEAWCTCHKACEQVKSRDPAESARGLKALVSFREYGLLCENLVETTVKSVRTLPAAQNESFQAELAVILSNYEQAMGFVREKMSVTSRPQTSRFEKVIASMEGFVDAGDAVKRRRRANRVYKDLVGERISIERAVLELQALNKRQKGGWLKQKLISTQKIVARNLAGFLLRRVK